MLSYLAKLTFTFKYIFVKFLKPSMALKLLHYFILVSVTLQINSEEEDRLQHAKEFFGIKNSQSFDINDSGEKYVTITDKSNENLRDEYLTIVKLKDEFKSYLTLRKSNIEFTAENSICNKRKIEPDQEYKNINYKKRKLLLSTSASGSLYPHNLIDFKKFDRETLQNNELCNLLVDCLFDITNYCCNLDIFAKAIFKKISLIKRKSLSTERRLIYRTIKDTSFIKNMFISGLKLMDFYIDMYLTSYYEYLKKEYKVLADQENENKNNPGHSGKS